MVQAGRGSRLVVEALQMSRIHHRRERQHFECYSPPQGHLLRLIDDAHTALADLANYAKVAQLLAFCDRRADRLASQRGGRLNGARTQGQSAQSVGVLEELRQLRE